MNKTNIIFGKREANCLDSVSPRNLQNEEIQRLTNVSAHVFLDNEERFNQARQWREKAERALEEDIPNCGEAESLIGSINALILREQGELREQRNWRYLAIAIMAFYVIGLAYICIFTDATRSNAPIPVFSIPLSVIMWGAIGSLATILYRFFTERGRIRFDLEVRWLIARPMIGIIMGAVVYLGLMSGLFLLGATANNTPQIPNASIPPIVPTTGRWEVYWIIAFLAGFSDKFYISIINLLVRRTIGREEEIGQEIEESRTTQIDNKGKHTVRRQVTKKAIHQSETHNKPDQISPLN